MHTDELRAELADLANEIAPFRGDPAAVRRRVARRRILSGSIVAAVIEFPQMNALFDDDRGVITQYNPVHIGVATQTPSGLMVPVLRNAESYGLWGCAGAGCNCGDGAQMAICA